MKLHNIATGISYFFSPLWMLPLSIYLIMHQISPDSAMLVTALLLILVLLPIVILLFYLIKIGKIEDWDIQKRQGRQLINSFGLICGILLALLLKGWQMKTEYEVLVFFLFALGCLTLVNFFWKISVHAASVTLLVLVWEDHLANWQIWPLFLIPLVGWARIYRKNHTLGEVIGGIMLSLVTIYLVKTLNLI